MGLCARRGGDVGYDEILKMLGGGTTWAYMGAVEAMRDIAATVGDTGCVPDIGVTPCLATAGAGALW